jgi:phage-related minor tail protein
MTASEIQQEIDRTRERLGETVEELAAKADVKARAKEKAVEMKAKAQGKVTEVSGLVKGKVTEVSGLVKGKATDVSGRVKQNQAVQRRWPLAAAAAVSVLAAGIVVWRRRKT